MIFKSKHKGAAVDAGVRPYKVYSAKIAFQNGELAPDYHLVFENSIGEITWQKIETGFYRALSDGLFNYGKTFVIVSNIDEFVFIPPSSSLHRLKIIAIKDIGQNFVDICCFEQDGNLTEISTTPGYTAFLDIEIRVYP